MTRNRKYYVHPKRDKLERCVILQNYGGIGVDWVEFEDGAKAPMLSLRQSSEKDRENLKRERLAEIVQTEAENSFPAKTRWLDIADAIMACYRLEPKE